MAMRDLIPWNSSRDMRERRTDRDHAKGAACAIESEAHRDQRQIKAAGALRSRPPVSGKKHATESARTADLVVTDARVGGPTSSQQVLRTPYKRTTKCGF